MLGLALSGASADAGSDVVHLVVLVPVLVAGLVMRSRAIWVVVAAAGLLHVLLVLATTSPGRAVGGPPLDHLVGLVVLGLLGLVLDPRRRPGPAASPGVPLWANGRGGQARADDGERSTLVEAADVEALSRLVPLAEPAGLGTGLLVVELDLLAELVDAHGRRVADAALTHTAQVLRGAVRPGDTVARLGTEELVVLMPGVGPDAVAPRAEALRRAARDAPLRGADGEIQVTVSVGAAHTSSGAGDLVDLHASATADLEVARPRWRRPVDPAS